MSPDGIKHQRFRMADGRDGYGDGFDGYSGYALVSSQDGRESILMARSDRREVSGTRFVSSSHRDWRENTVVKTDMSGFGRKAGKTLAERDPPNSADNVIPLQLSQGNREHDRVYRHNGIRAGRYRCWRPWPNIETLNARSQENGQGYALETG